MEKCKNCKHWTPPAADDSWRETEICKPSDPETFEPMVMPFEVRICKSPKMLFCERPVESNGTAVADGSDYFASLMTGEDFGCINFEAVET